MADEAMRSRSPAGHAGLFNSLFGLIDSLIECIASRSALFAKESRAVLAQLLIVIACVVAALIFFTLGYLFLVGSIVVAVARLAEISWIWVAFGAAGLHFLLAIVCLIVAKTRVTHAPYPELSAELKRDREWLKNLDQSSRPTL
jgi:cell division protein FtsW (lipid II flippase)